MTISPYDNLPVAGRREDEEALQYIDVPVEEIEEATEAVHAGEVEVSPPEPAMPEPAPSELEPEPAMPEPVPAPESAPAPAAYPEASAAPVPTPASVPAPAPARNEQRTARAFTKVTAPEPAPRYSKLNIKNMWDMNEYILPFEETLLVPDTMPDMAEIMFAEGSVSPSQPAKTTYTPADPVSGEVVIYTIYKPAVSSPVDVVKSSVSFRTDKCWENADGDSFRVSLKLRSVSAEMLNERKFIVKGTVRIRFTQLVQKELMVFGGIDDGALVKRETAIHAADLASECSETTEISQDIDLNEDQSPPLKILKETYRIVETHKQITSGKLVINGAVLSSILYLGQDDDGWKPCALSNRTDFTQFIVMDKDTDVSLVHTSFTGDGFKASVETQSRISIQGQIHTHVCCYENRELTMVSDAYHRDMEISFDTSDQLLSSISGTVSGEISSREVVNIDEYHRKPETFLCGSCLIDEISGRAERGRIVIEGSMAVKILALDEEETPFVINSSIPVRGALEMADAAQDLKVDISAEVKEFWFDSINSRQMEINAGICLEARAISRENFRTIENLCFVESDRPAGRVPLAIYVVGRDDTLWDIAKRYRSDMESLAKLNGLEGDRLPEEGTKLFVMK